MKRQGLAAAFIVSTAVGLSAVTGCTTESFCFDDCGSGGSAASGTGGTAATDGGGTGGISTDGGGSGGIYIDGGGSGGGDACVPNPPEACNGIDDDCDGTIDNGFDLTQPEHCGTCATICTALPHTVNQTCEPPATLDGKTPGTCKFSCEIDFYDIDPNDPGCEYQCTYNPNGTNTIDTGPPSGLCNADDDCDGQKDEDLNLCSDVENCGACGFKCVIPNGTAKCVTTATGSDPCTKSNTGCEVATCDPGYYDNDKSGANGCEYNCPVATPGPEVCNGQDDDCDGLIDNADDSLESNDPLVGEPTLGDACNGGTQGECATIAHQGVKKCIAGLIECCDQESDNENGTNPALPVNGIRNGVCDSAAGPQVMKPGDVVETCNTKDDDCDGVDDDNPTDAGGQCGSSVGNCQKGTEQCQSGALVCVGKIDPQAETCNGQDDNCDGVIDGTIPFAAPKTCTTNANCAADEWCAQVGAAKQCVNSPANAVGDCAPPGLQLPVPPPCQKGSLSCIGGTVQCVGYVGPTGSVDTCGVDANCDGQLTNQPNLQTDKKNCGSCGNDCDQIAPGGHGVWACQSGACVRTGCDVGYINCDANNNTCEKACTFISANEQCNGLDDNCNCQTDESVGSPPSPVQACGVSPAATDAGCTTGVTVACTGGGWQCTFPAGYCTGSKPNYCTATTDTCDSQDNNCNGAVDENFKPPVLNQGYVGQPCASDDGLAPPGHGACKGLGQYVCTGPSSTACNATKDLTKVTAEACDAVDNDCDGTVDEPFKATTLYPAGKGTNVTYWVKPAVTQIGASLWVTQYEVSRTAATSTNPGSGNGYQTSAPLGVTLDKTQACSVSGVVPWFNLNPVEASQTCAERGGRLCSTAEWQTACRATVNCTWGYNPRGAACTSTYTGTKYCNIGPFDFDSVAAGNQDGLLPTASGSLQNCWADWSGTTGNPAATDDIRDITGNLREITNAGGNLYKLMGGAFNTDAEAGAACGFTFYTVDQNYKLFDVGYRCCFDQNPS